MKCIVVFFACYIISCVQCYLKTSSEVNCSASAGCLLWRPEKEAENGTCKSDLVNRVKCERDEYGAYYLSLLPCYCMTQYADNSSVAVVGLCPYTCREEVPLLHYISLPSHVNVSDLSHVVCKNFSRSGQMCGQCESGHALAAYSYTLNCVNCTEHKMNWLKYVGIAYGPQTLFFILAVFGRLSVTSGLMVGYVTVSQVAATSIELRFKASELHNDRVLKVLYTLYGVWNLDFFRGLYTPFCLHPHMPPLSVISLDFAVALYPMCLIVLAYAVLTVYDKYKSAFRCWTLFHRLIHRCYQECDIRNSLIDAFATMFILSYVKILNTSFELLLPVYLSDKNGEVKETAVFYSGDLKYFGTQHLPYAILAIFMSLTFNLFPLVLLTLYPFRCFQRFLSKCWKGPGIHNVMDDFYRCYRTTPRDHRYFAVVYLYLRWINLALLLVTLSPAYFALISILYMSMAIFIALVQPYKLHSHNVINAGLFFLLAIIKILEDALEFSFGVYEHFVMRVYYGIELILYFVPPFYGLLILMYQILPKRPLFVLKQVVQKFRRVPCKEEPAVPHHVDEFTSLVN